VGNALEYAVFKTGVEVDDATARDLITGNMFLDL
jgi:hypothetical protein